jgi:Ni,Fe-hydrogenase I cytochrome b subunit
MIAEFFSTFPTVFWLLIIIVVVVCGGLILYALHCKGDVSAEISHGMTSFKLQAKERLRRKNLG